MSEVEKGLKSRKSQRIAEQLWEKAVSSSTAPKRDSWEPSGELLQERHSLIPFCLVGDNMFWFTSQEGQAQEASR